MSVNIENTTDGSEARSAEEIDGTINGVSLELIEGMISANLEPLNAQISTLIQLLNQLTQDNYPNGGFIVHQQDLHPLGIPETLGPYQIQLLEA